MESAKLCLAFHCTPFPQFSLSSPSQCLPLISSAVQHLPWIHADKRWKEPRLQPRWDTTTVLLNLSFLLHWEEQQWEEGSSQGHNFQENTGRLCAAPSEKALLEIRQQVDKAALYVKLQSFFLPHHWAEYTAKHLTQTGTAQTRELKSIVQLFQEQTKCQRVDGRTDGEPVK